MVATFFDDEELIALGITLPTVDALRTAYLNSSADGGAGLTLAQIVQIGLDASSTADEASNLAGTIQKNLNTLQLRLNDTDYSAEFDRISKQIGYIQLLIAGIPDQEARFSALEKRLTNVELIAHGNNNL
jgi:hypothetical protein